MFGLLRRFADQKLQRELADVQAELEAERRRLAVAQAEIESQAAVIVRDRMRTKAETAEAVSRIAAAGGE